MTIKPGLYVNYCRTYGIWCQHADEIGQCRVSGCTRLKPYQVSVESVMLWDDPIIVMADFARNNDMSAFAVAVERGFLGEKTFKFFDDNKEYEILVKAQEVRDDG